MNLAQEVSHRMNRHLSMGLENDPSRHLLPSLLPGSPAPCSEQSLSSPLKKLVQCSPGRRGGWQSQTHQPIALRRQLLCVQPFAAWEARSGFPLAVFLPLSPGLSFPVCDVQGQLLGKPEGGSLRPKQSEMLSPAAWADSAPQQMIRDGQEAPEVGQDPFFKLIVVFPTFCCLWSCLTKQDEEGCM